MQVLEDILGSRTNLQILRHLVAISGGLSGNEIATRLGLGESSVRQALKRLQAAGIVTRTDMGNSALYALDHELDFARHLLIPLFQAETGLHQAVIATLLQACRKLKPQPNAVILFGSVARGAADSRDIDLLCTVSKAQDKSAVHDAVADGFGALRSRYRLPVSAIVATETELSSPRFASLLKEVQREGLLLLGKAPGILKGVKRHDT
jgi:DNA-binding transcriptional ArsR family regulator